MDDAVERVLKAIESGELQPEDLTARRIGALLGKTTSVLYHHWGSLDVFLYDVSHAGHLQLARTLEGLAPCEMAEAYVRFAVARPGLYELMFHRRWDWAALRERRDLAREVHCSGAGGIASRIALQPAKPVYSRISNHGPDQHRPDDIGNSARRSGG